MAPPFCFRHQLHPSSFLPLSFSTPTTPSRFRRRRHLLPFVFDTNRTPSSSPPLSLVFNINHTRTLVLFSKATAWGLTFSCFRGHSGVCTIVHLNIYIFWINMVWSWVHTLLNQNQTTFRTGPWVRFGVHQVSLNRTIGRVHGSAKVVRKPDRTEPWQHSYVSKTFRCLSKALKTSKTLKAEIIYDIQNMLRRWYKEF